MARNTLLEIYDRGKHLSEVTWIKDGSWDTAQIQFQLNGILRLLPVQPDPRDATHFSIPYELDNVPGRIEAYLKNDDTVADSPERRADSRSGSFRVTCRLGSVRGIGISA